MRLTDELKEWFLSEFYITYKTLHPKSNIPEDLDDIPNWFEVKTKESFWHRKYAPKSKLNVIIKKVNAEFKLATNKYGKFHSAHEGYAILLEEVEELWDNIKLNQDKPERNRLIQEEAIQVAAMAIRLIFDCCKVSYDFPLFKKNRREYN